jgi:hypothetical protein
MAWQQPKTNWDTHPKAIEPADLNRIEGNIEVVRGKSDLPLRLEVVEQLPVPCPRAGHISIPETKWRMCRMETVGCRLPRRS